MLLFRHARYSGPMKHFFTHLALVVFCTQPVFAAQPGWDAFVRGDFSEARTIGRSAGTAESLAHACRAGLVQGGFIETGIKAVKSLHGAIRDCDKALQLDPTHFFAKMSLAIALSFEGKRLKRPAYPKMARLLLLELTQKHPRNPLGYGALGAWHSEVSAAGFMARLALGARRKIAENNYQKALAFGTIDFALRFEHVKFLARGKKIERKIALREAKALVEETVDTALDRLLQQRCKVLYEALQSGNKRRIKTALKASGAFQGAGRGDAPHFPLETLSNQAAD